jgi:hypothetical protein
MARLIRRVAIGKVVPRCAGSHYPKDAVENFACIFPRPSPTVGSTRRKGDQRIENGPLLVRQIHYRYYTTTSLTVPY